MNIGFSNIEQFINDLKVSKSWKDKFKRLHLKYYNNYSNGKINNPLFWKSSIEYKEMSLFEKMRFSPWINIWGFLFGPFYYLAKGMWLKGLLLLLLTCISCYLISIFIFFIPESLIIGVLIIPQLFWLYCALNADKDYFNHKVLNNKQIKSYLLNNLLQKDLALSSELIESLLTQSKNAGDSWVISRITSLIVIAVLITMQVYILGSCASLIKFEIAYKKSPTNPARLQEYDEKISKGSNDYRIYAYRAKINVISYGDYKGALADLDKAFQLNPNDSWLYYSRYCLKESLKDYKGALADLNKAIRLSPNDSKLYTSRARFKELYLKDYQSALADLNKAIKLNTANMPSKINAELAREVNSIDIHLNQKSDLYADRGNLYFSLKNYKLALQDFDAAINNNCPDYLCRSLRFKRGITRYYVNDTKGALEDLDVAYKHYSDTVFFKSEAQKVKSWIDYIKDKSSTSSKIQITEKNKLILNSKDKNTYNILVNKPSEFDFLSKGSILNIRKKYTAKYPNLIAKNYSPSDTVFGQIISNKPWWGLKGINCKGSGKHSIDGLSEESRFINNPLLLIGVSEPFSIKVPEWNCSDIYPEPVKIYYQPSENKGTVVYNLSDYFRKIKNTDWDKRSDIFLFNWVNARDFGYNYAYAYYSKNVTFTYPNKQTFTYPTNLETDIQPIKSFIHAGGSCGYPGLCNNDSPYQPALQFDVKQLPAIVKIKLWKQNPSSIKDQADIYFDVVLN